MTDLELLQSFGQSYPEEFDGTLDSISAALTCAFNRTGSLLAVGCNDGRLVVWDFLTRGIAKVYSAHVHPVCSVSWSRNGRKLLSASTDWNVAVWDVLSGDCEHRYRFPSAIYKVQFHPRNNNTFLVCPMKHPPVLVEVNGEHHILPVGEECEQNIVAAFDRKGDYIFTGNAKGKIIVIETETLKLKASFRISTPTNANTAVKSIEFPRRGSAFIVNSQDRVIRVFDCRIVLSCEDGIEPEPIQKLQDLVNRTLWKKCCFSGDGEYIVAGSSRQHALYIWERSAGNLVKILNGTKGELLLDVIWHPIRPIICSAASGLISIWSQTHVENWSAFAPDFKELDENVVYEETESEFDIEDEDKKEEILEGIETEHIDVDVVTVEKPFYYSSDEGEGEDNLYYLPVAPEVDDPEGEMPPLEPPQNAQMNTGLSGTIDAPVSDSEKRLTSLDEGEGAPPKKKTKVIDVQINGDIFSQSGDVAVPEKPTQDRTSKPKKDSMKTKRGTSKKSSNCKTKKVDTEDENSQEVPDSL